MTHKFALPIVFLLTSIALSVSLIGCGSNWRIHEDERQIQAARMQSPSAPDWTQGSVPMTDDRIYFIGRSTTPDMPRRGGFSTGDSAATPDGRTGFTVMDERDAIQSARTDVQDQIMQRLRPRNYGTTGQIATRNVDVGTCVDCCAVIDAVLTGVQRTANQPSYAQGCSPWNTTQLCASCKATRSAQPDALPSGHDCGSACDAARPTGQVAETIVGRDMQRFRCADYIPMLDHQIDRDINISNTAIDSVMPALLAQLQEEKTYFEKWWVHEGDDEYSRPNAQGRDEWQSYKCWVLCSIPRSEFMRIAEEFRARYAELYEQTMAWNLEDRQRRLDLEDLKIATELDWQEEERAQNREDEKTEIQHSIELDKDRETMPGRRMRPVASAKSTNSNR